MSSVTPIDAKPDEIKASVERLTRYLDDIIANEKLLAKIVRAKYVALVAEGFAPDEAMRIVIGQAR